MPTIYADFNNADVLGRVRLNTVGTCQDLARTGVELYEGLRLTIADEELEAEGGVEYSTDERMWVARVDWDRIRSHGRE